MEALTPGVREPQQGKPPPRKSLPCNETQAARKQANKQVCFKKTFLIRSRMIINKNNHLTLYNQMCQQLEDLQNTTK